MYEMLFGYPAYYTNISKEILFYNINHAKLTFPRKISDEAKSIITKVFDLFYFSCLVGILIKD